MAETATREDYRDGKPFSFGSARYRNLWGWRAGNPLMDAAESVGLINRSTGWWAGHRSRTVNLADRYRTGDYRIVDVESLLRKDPIEIRRSQPADQPQPKEMPLDEVAMWLVSRFPMFGFSPSVSPRNHWERLLLDQITNHRFRASRDAFGLRLHSSWTGVSKQMRNWAVCVVQHIERGETPPVLSDSLTLSCAARREAHSLVIAVDGRAQALLGQPDGQISAHIRETAQQLVELDLATCQPLILGTLAAEDYLDVPSDLREWLDICQTGDLYEYLAEQVARRFGVPFNRSDVKGDFALGARPDAADGQHPYAAQTIMIACFAEPKMAAASMVGQIMREQFPTVWAFLERLRRQPPTDDCKKAYKHTAQQCQRFESARMIDGVCGRLMQSHPELPILTIHDAVIVPRWAVQAVKDTIFEEFAPFSVEPNLRETALGTPNA